MGNEGDLRRETAEALLTGIKSAAERWTGTTAGGDSWEALAHAYAHVIESMRDRPKQSPSGGDAKFF
jgi:hypothetical protein